MQSYSAFEYLWPPRPTTKDAVPQEMLRYYERKGWIGQIKKNGTCSVIFVSPEKEVTAMNRHNEVHKAWAFTDASRAAFKNLPGKGWYVFVAELLHNKGGEPRDTNYIFDVLVDDGEYLVGVELQERLARLLQIFPVTDEVTDDHYVVNKNTWIVKPFTEGFRERFEGLTAQQDEGIVVKKPSSTLEFCKSGANTAWQKKIRKVHKNFSF